MRAFQIIIGIILLLPGICGAFFFAPDFIFELTLKSRHGYGPIVSMVAVPSIQLTCLGLWFSTRNSNNQRLRDLTRVAGVVGAISAGGLLILATKVALSGMFVGAINIAAFAIIPFLIGGLPALLLKPEPEGRVES